MKKAIALVIVCFTLFFMGCSSNKPATSSNPASQQKEPAKETKKATSLPDGDETIIVWVAAGGGSDLTLRALAESSKDFLGKNIVVVNKPGAGGSVGLSEAANKKPDGLTTAMYTSDLFTLPIFQKTTFTSDDFEPVVLVNFDPACLVVPANSRYKTLDDFIQEAKKNPGKISVGNSGFGNIWHISTAALAQKTGIEVKQIPHDGGAPTVQAALGGHIDAFVASPPEVAPQVEAGQLRMLAVMADERLKKFPDVPTLKENKIDLSIGTWRGLAVPKGTSKESIQTLSEAFSKGAQSESFKKFMDEKGFGIKFMNNEQFKKFIVEQKPYFEELAKSIKDTKK